MRPRKLSKEQVLLQSAQCFKSYGYTACSMGILAEACGLSKAAFYYDYPTKDALVMDMLSMTQLKLRHGIFHALQEQTADPQSQFMQIHQQAVQFFNFGGLGCLAGAMSMESRHLPQQINEKLREIFREWQHAFEAFFSHSFSQSKALDLAKISVADYEGAILMARITQDESYLTLIRDRILNQLADS